MPPPQVFMPDRGMRKRGPTKNNEAAQQGLFEVQAPPVIPPEVLREVHAALVELLLDAARPNESEARDER